MQSKDQRTKEQVAKGRRRQPLLDPYGLIGNPILVAVHGRVGDVVYKTYGTKIIVTRVPSFDGYMPTAAQRARRDRMKEATAYAKRVYADPVAKALYAAAAQKLRRQPFRLAVSDYLSSSAPAVSRRGACATLIRRKNIPSVQGGPCAPRAALSQPSVVVPSPHPMAPRHSLPSGSVGPPAVITLILSAAADGRRRPFDGFRRCNRKCGPAAAVRDRPHEQWQHTLHRAPQSRQVLRLHFTPS